MPEERGRVLLLGGTGFVGAHLSAQLSARWQVSAFGRGLDVRDAVQLEQAIRSIDPDHVVYLSALTTLGESASRPAEMRALSAGGLANLFAALGKTAFAGTVLFVSSGEVYGPVPPEHLPVNESQVPDPRSAYAQAKLEGEALCRQWSRGTGGCAVIARPFNHIGPGQSARFAIAAFARQIVAIERGEAPAVLKVGDIDTTRDFLDVRDVAEAYEALLTVGVAGETYNVCSGVERTVRSLLEEMLALAGTAVEIELDPARIRPGEQRRSWGDDAKLKAAAGWQPHRDIGQTLGDVLAAARGAA
ncbi:MAG: GDP-mannose 4,6-dehydratase [Burkholderiales bacterium]|nr:GDP-mannose 4,6-dehydratase [Burkholderiales bacterium]